MVVKFIVKQKIGQWIKLPVSIEEDKGRYIIKFPYNAQLVDEVRNFSGAKWNPELKLWTAEICERNNYALQYLTGYRDPNYSKPILNPDDLTFSRPLFKHQKEGVAFGLSRKRCMLAFKMGLGKSLTAIEIMERAAGLSKDQSNNSNYSIIYWWLVAPFGAQKQWERELKHWNSRVQFTVTTTYESLHKWLETMDQPPQGVIFDESIKIKNPAAQRSQYAYELTRLMRAKYKDPFIILLSGSPAPKEPTDWWHQIECMFPGWLKQGNIYKFKNHYANTVEVDRGYGVHREVESWKQDEVEKLGTRLRPIVLVKKKEDCFDFPPKVFERIQCTIDTELRQAAELIAVSAGSGIEALERLRELSDGFQYLPESKEVVYAGSNKLRIVRELLDFYSVDNGGIGRLVIFAAFHASVDKLLTICKEEKWSPYRIDGRGWSHSDTLEKFEDLRYQNVVVVANPACVYGLNLSKTECLCYYSNSFNPDARTQSLDRRDRPGMNVEKGTRVVDIINLPTDLHVLKRLNEGLDLQSITLEEISKWLRE